MQKARNDWAVKDTIVRSGIVTSATMTRVTNLVADLETAEARVVQLKSQLYALHMDTFLAREFRDMPYGIRKHIAITADLLQSLSQALSSVIKETCWNIERQRSPESIRISSKAFILDYCRALAPLLPKVRYLASPGLLDEEGGEGGGAAPAAFEVMQLITRHLIKAEPSKDPDDWHQNRQLRKFDFHMFEVAKIRQLETRESDDPAYKRAWYTAATASFCELGDCTRWDRGNLLGKFFFKTNMFLKFCLQKDPGRVEIARWEAWEAVEASNRSIPAFKGYNAEERVEMKRRWMVEMESLFKGIEVPDEEGQLCRGSHSCIAT
ncbi:hypothetical protein MMC25_006115 [Agyrium rufum]|nr:hypothetical protein [Agyrium rufum]